MRTRRTKYTRTYGRTRVRSMNLSIMENNPYLCQTIELEKLNQWESLHLEIGFGNGENLLHRVAQFPNTLQVGVDVYKNGICKILSSIKNNHMNNLILVPMDVREFLDVNPELYFHHIYIMFPDPWHKKSEKKREKKRLVNKEFLQQLYHLLSPNGYIVFASDHKDYYENVKIFFNEIGLSSPNHPLGIKSDRVNNYGDYFPEGYFVPSNYEKKATNDCYYLIVKKQ